MNQSLIFAEGRRWLPHNFPQLRLGDPKGLPFFLPSFDDPAAPRGSFLLSWSMKNSDQAAEL
jgi:hypothetical protein